MSSPAHSLSDIFERRIGDQVTRVDENLYPIEVNSEKLLKEHKEKYKKHIKAIIDRGTLADPEDVKSGGAETKRLLASLRKPGMPAHRMTINKITPRTKCISCQHERMKEPETLRIICDELSELGIGEMPLLSREIQGMDDLTDFSRLLCDGRRENVRIPIR